MRNFTYTHKCLVNSTIDKSLYDYPKKVHLCHLNDIHVTISKISWRKKRNQRHYSFNLDSTIINSKENKLILWLIPTKVSKVSQYLSKRNIPLGLSTIQSNSILINNRGSKTQKNL